jgi:hypothetical protein
VALILRALPPRKALIPAEAGQLRRAAALEPLQSFPSTHLDLAGADLPTETMRVAATETMHVQTMLKA